MKKMKMPINKYDGFVKFCKQYSLQIISAVSDKDFWGDVTMIIHVSTEGDDKISQDEKERLLKEKYSENITDTI